MTSAFSWQNSISFCPASFRIPRPNLPVTPGVSWLPTFAFQKLEQHMTYNKCWKKIEWRLDGWPWSLYICLYLETLSLIFFQRMYLKISLRILSVPIMFKPWSRYLIALPQTIATSWSNRFLLCFSCQWSCLNNSPVHAY